MLRARIIPCLLVHQGGLFNTCGFSDPKYLGDPINTVRIFNEKQVDELIVLDIDASVLGRDPDYNLISALAAECRMPLCYGGGVKTVEHIEKIVSLGVEKVSLGSVAALNPSLIQEASHRVGSQSIVAVLDVKKTGLLGRYEVFIHNGRKRVGRTPQQMVKEFTSMGAGEILVNSIDRDGMMQGYDLELIDIIRNSTSLPITALGGAGSVGDFRALVDRYGPIGAAAGSFFVFKGKYRAVLVQYIKSAQKDYLTTIR